MSVGKGKERKIGCSVCMKSNISLDFGFFVSVVRCVSCVFVCSLYIYKNADIEKVAIFYIKNR